MRRFLLSSKNLEESVIHYSLLAAGNSPSANHHNFSGLEKLFWMPSKKCARWIPSVKL